jgi:hypothetical protein
VANAKVCIVPLYSGSALPPSPSGHIAVPSTGNTTTTRSTPSYSRLDPYSSRRTFPSVPTFVIIDLREGEEEESEEEENCNKSSRFNPLVSLISSAHRAPSPESGTSIVFAGTTFIASDQKFRSDGSKTFRT